MSLRMRRNQLQQFTINPFEAGDMCDCKSSLTEWCLRAVVDGGRHLDSLEYSNEMFKLTLKQQEKIQQKSSLDCSHTITFDTPGNVAHVPGGAIPKCQLRVDHQLNTQNVIPRKRRREDDLTPKRKQRVLQANNTNIVHEENDMASLQVKAGTFKCSCGTFVSRTDKFCRECGKALYTAPGRPKQQELLESKVKNGSFGDEEVLSHGCDQKILSN